MDYRYSYPSVPSLVILVSAYEQASTPSQEFWWQVLPVLHWLEVVIAFVSSFVYNFCCLVVGLLCNLSLKLCLRQANYVFYNNNNIL